jgi:hypothetical protein
MSRFTKTMNDGTIVAYGHDHALGYFIDVFKEAEDDIEEDEVIVEKCSMFGSSNGDILKVMEEYEVNPDHIKLVALDLTF